jgi:hypothetical protein
MIRITFLGESQRSAVREYDTDDLAEALRQEATRGFTLKEPEEGKPYSDNRGPNKWILCFVVERDDARYEQDEIVEAFRRISNLERIRGNRQEER